MSGLGSVTTPALNASPEIASAAFLSAVQKCRPAIRKAIGVETLDPRLLTAAERLQ